MQRHEILELEQTLLACGIRKQIARRSVEELYDHYEDLLAYHREHGVSDSKAEIYAAEELGSIDVIQERFVSRDELQDWPSRHPLIASTLGPLQTVGQIVSLEERFAAASSRWLTGLVVSGVVTASMMLVLQYSLTLS